ncbi:MAG: hypothetical protein IJ354_10920 [Clostridia bacterium]|nr:hypothetical protein [Clostridia bacterium]
MRLTKERLATVCFWLAVVVMLIVGRYTYQDYGLTVDENVERESAFMSYQHAAELLFDKEISVFDQDLSEYADRYYGVALQLPMVAVEHLTGFTMPLRDAFLLRHLYTFLVCMTGWVCFYFFCKKVFRDGWLALLGMLMCALYPRFWGEQFTNIKDMMFAASCCASLLVTAVCIEKEEKRLNEVISAFVFALCANTRFIGFMFPAVLFGYRVLRDALQGGLAKTQLRQWLQKNLPQYCINIVLVFGFYIIVSPVAWNDPIDYLRNVFGTFSNFTKYGGNVLFLGKFYPANQLPWYYLPVWITLTAPIWYLVLMGAGAFDGAKQLACRLRQRSVSELLLNEYRYFILCFVVAAIALVTPIVKEVTLYCSWRHMYYIFPSLIVLALFGVRAVFRKMHGRRWIKNTAVVVICLLFAGQIGWTVYNHPFEKVYFNVAGRQVADSMERDYWNEADYQQIQTILRNDDTPRINISGDIFTGRTLNYFLDEEQMKRFYTWYGYPPEVEYIIDSADTYEYETYTGYTPVHELRMKDGLLLSTIHIRDDVLQERFDGVYPEYNVP